MEFLKEVLGEELYAQVESKLTEHNGSDANKEKQIKLGNLGGGEYVAKGKYESVTADLASKQSELDKANGLIAEMKKASEGNADLQSKISEYENTVSQLQQELSDTKLEAALKVSLLAEKAADVDYFTFKLRESVSRKGETLELDDNGSIKGWDSKIAELKTAYPKMFETQSGLKVLDGGKLPDGDSNPQTEPETLEQALMQRYENE
ncbi:MAG: phage scaffolding protein [Oscillospiraceae bacterium]|nr:phage scaffolding protein [Oscillospiraceae bacterium]